jgi:15-cis-phytoene synthase
MQIDDSLLNRAAPPGSMRYFSLLYAPEERRDALAAIHVIDTEVRESALSASHDVAHTRLQWWRTEIDRLVNGAAQHPATRLLSEQHAGDRTMFAKFHELLAAADMDLARMTYENARELRAYCSRSGGVVQEIVAAQLASPAPLADDVRAIAHRLGIGVRAAELVRDIRQDAHDGRIYLPLDMLERHDVAPAALNARDATPQVRQALQSFAESARADLEPPSRSAHGAALRPIIVLAALHRRLLDRIAARNYDVASGRIELGPVEKPWVAWRAARKAG